MMGPARPSRSECQSANLESEGYRVHTSDLRWQGSLSVPRATSWCNQRPISFGSLPLAMHLGVPPALMVMLASTSPETKVGRGRWCLMEALPPRQP